MSDIDLVDAYGSEVVSYLPCASGVRADGKAARRHFGEVAAEPADGAMPHLVERQGNRCGVDVFQNGGNQNCCHRCLQLPEGHLY